MMNQKIKKKHIYLIGFMGSGKSTTGELLAKQLSRPFLDTDELIENLEDQSIPEIFNKLGEAYFRQIESEIIERSSLSTPSVVALGGGAFTIERNREIVHQHGISIYLKWPPTTLYQRLKNSSNRPLLYSHKPEDLFKYIENLLKRRKIYYKMADIIIDGDSCESEEMLVRTIIERIENYHEKD